MRCSKGRFSERQQTPEKPGVGLITRAPSQAALRCAYSELLTGDDGARQRAKAFLNRHRGALTSLPVDALRGIVSSAQEPHVVLRMLRELRNHPQAIEHSTPVLAHLMRFGEATVPVVAAKVLSSIRGVRDVVAIPVLSLAASKITRHRRVAQEFENNLRGAEIFDLEVYRAPVDTFRTQSVEQQAAALYRQREREWYSSDTGRAVVLGALTSGCTHVKRLALETLLLLNYAAISDRVRLLLETSLAFNARAVVSDTSPRLVRDLFMKVASSLQHAPELASILLESARQSAPRSLHSEVSPEIPAKLFYGAAVLLRGGSVEEAIQGVGAFLELHEPTALNRIAMRLVHLSAELPESSGQQAVEMLLGALRDRIDVEGAEQELCVLMRAVKGVSGYDSVVVDFCGKLLAEGEGIAVESVITEILTHRVGQMLQDGSAEKARAMLCYIEGKHPDQSSADRSIV